MTIVLLDLVCALLVLVGLTFAFRGTVTASPSDPAVYMRRIAGMMLAAFAFALGAMMTAYYFA